MADRRERLEDELEGAGIALLLHERLAHAGEERVGAETFLRAIGMEGFIDVLRTVRRLQNRRAK
ncbi:MAG: hypothetical protein M3401_18820 [Actinomycetota bacterium]|nr:hypothetical protein [Actinomycetota bacterium]